MMRRLVCCRRRTKDYSIDLEEHERIMTYNGLESCILNSCSYGNGSGASGMSGSDGCVVTDSLNEDSASCSSSKEAFGSSFSSCSPLSRKQEEEHMLDEWETVDSLHLCSKGKKPITYTMNHLEVQTMKERFAKLLLGEDASGGTKALSTALALSNAITSLSVSVFGELWKLEPLSEERKNRWRREMDWLLSPMNYMVELVPAKQRGSNGRMLEIMTPKPRSDIHVNLLALQKLDSLLIDALDSMVENEFWYVEGSSRDEGCSPSSGTRSCKRWWLPTPRVPEYGLSPGQRKRLGIHAKLVNQVLKAAKSINEQALLQMTVPEAVKDALPKSGKESLGEIIYRVVTAAPCSSEETFISLNLKSEHAVLETINRLEGAIFAWKQRISEVEIKRSPIHYPWFFRDGGSETVRMELWLERAQMLVRLLKSRFPNLPLTFIDLTKVQYNKDVGHSIIEAYSRVVVNITFSILSRIGDILQEDDLKKPCTPIATLKFDFFSDVYLAGITETPPGNIRRSLIHQMNSVDGRCFRNTKEAEHRVPQPKHQAAAAAAAAAAADFCSTNGIET